MQSIGVFLVFVVYVALFLFQTWAFFDGIHEWLGLGNVSSVVVLAISFFIGPLGSLFVAGVGLYGMITVWGWPWWQAVAATFPFAVISLIMASVAGIGGMVGRLINRD